MSTVAPKPTALQCPSCNWDWNDVPRPAMTRDPHPVVYNCPNRKCRERHWVMLYQVTFFPQPRWNVVAIEKSLGPDPASLRDSLRQFPQLSEADVDEFVALAELKPELIFDAA